MNNSFKNQYIGLPFSAKLEWLESSGKQFIDTGYIPDSRKTTFEVEFASTQPSGEIWAGGVRGSAGNYDIAVQTNSKIMFDCFINIPVDVAYPRDGSFFKLKLQRRACFVNDVKVAEHPYEISGDGVPLYLFTPNRPPGLLDSNARLKSAKIYDNDILVMNFIPVRANNVGYMYDAISGKLFGNGGDGKLICGPDI